MRVFIAMVSHGGKVDDRHGAPVAVTGRVIALGNGRFVHQGPMLRGLPGRLGPTAVLQSGGVKIILIHYRAAFEPLAAAIIEVDAPGLSSSNLERFEFAHVRRPIFPLDDI